MTNIIGQDYSAPFLQTSVQGYSVLHNDVLVNVKVVGDLQLSE